MKTRKHDLENMLKFNPKILEFHFSDSDLNLELEGNFEQKLIVHCFEYFERKLLDIVSLKETNQVHSKGKSLELIQKAIDKTLSLSEQFQGTPTLIVHPGGYSLNELTPLEINRMRGMVVDSIRELDFKNVNFLLENMPPYAWFFGGRWNSNVFLSTNDMKKYCIETGEGYVLLQCNNKNDTSSFLTKFTVFSISSIFDIPVEIIIGFLILEIYLINGKFVKSAEAILYAGTLNFSRKSTLGMSHGVQRKVIFFSLQ